MRYTLIIIGESKPIYPVDQNAAWNEMVTRFPTAMIDLKPPRLSPSSRMATQEITFIVDGAPVGTAVAETMAVCEYIALRRAGTIWEV